LPKDKRYATSYKLKVTSDESGVQDCHPLLKSEGICKDEDIFPDPTTGQVYSFIEDNLPKIPYPTFNQARNDYMLFTRNHTYVWKVKACNDDIAQNCSDYSQAWSFSTKTDPIGVPAAIAPSNDASGQKLTSLPVTLSWTTPKGANSFIYETSFISGEKNN